ncbi:MAG: hypothetical protein J6Y02_09965 [Pseudobutyrivibrio sp.]|nr:hypothetical protein [Pseudobutyrivibrio sp.]
MNRKANLRRKRRWARKFIRKHGISVGHMLIDSGLIKFAADDVAPDEITELTFYYPEDREEYEEFVHDYEIDMKAGKYHMAICRKAWFYSQYNELNMPSNLITDFILANVIKLIRISDNFKSSVRVV